MRRWPCRLGIVLILAGLAGVGYWQWPALRRLTCWEPAYLSDPRLPQVRQLCSSCHVFPTPDILGKRVWDYTIDLMYNIMKERWPASAPTPPPIEQMKAFYTQYASEVLPASNTAKGLGSGPVHFKSRPLAFFEFLGSFPAVSSVRFANLFDDGRLDLLVCEMRMGMIVSARLDPQTQAVQPTILGSVPAPTHVEVVDLDADGIRDCLVASIGSDFRALEPADSRTGSIIWLRGDSSGRFQPITLFERLGRVADAQAADFDADGDLDIVVAVFGWRTVGGVLYLENQTTDYSDPQFDPYVLDGRTGPVAVPIVDLNQDGRPDIVTVIGQESEAVVAFLNLGNGEFDRKTLYAAPHPGWSYSGIATADLDGDGDQDVVLSNGDTLDNYALKACHGIDWLENQGECRFTRHRIAELHGAQRPTVADLDGDGDLDIATTAFMPHVRPNLAGSSAMASVAWLEQTSRGRFRLHPLEAGIFMHTSSDAADWDGDGNVDLAVANWGTVFAFGKPMLTTPRDHYDGSQRWKWVILFENQSGK